MAQPAILAGLVFSGDLEEVDIDGGGGPRSITGTKLVPGLKRMRAEGDSGAATSAGDGGLQWKAAALKRAMDEAEKTGASLDAVVAERWGSVAELTGGAAPDAFLRSAAAAARRLPRRGRGKGGRGRGRGGGGYGRGGDDAPRPRVRLGRDQSDGDVLKRYSKKLEGALDAAMTGRGAMAGGAAPPAPRGDDDAKGGDAWVGLASRSALGMSGASFKDGWRKRGAPDDPKPPPAMRARTVKAPARPRPPPAPAPVEVVQGDGESNASAAAAMRKRLGL